MIWAILFGMLFMGGGGSTFPVKIFSDEARAVLPEVVNDEARLDECLLIMKDGNKELKSSGKRASKIAKAFRKIDKNQETGVDELTPLLDELAAERTNAQRAALDRLVALKKSMTEDEWNAAFARLK